MLQYRVLEDAVDPRVEQPASVAEPGDCLLVVSQPGVDEGRFDGFDLLEADVGNHVHLAHVLELVQELLRRDLGLCQIQMLLRDLILVKRHLI